MYARSQIRPITPQTDGGPAIKVKLYIDIPDWLYNLGLYFVILYRRLRFGHPFRKVPLTKGKCAIIDPDDYAHLAKYKWRICTGKNTLYAERSVRLPSGRYSRILMHRQILGNLLLASPAQNPKLRTQNYHRYLSDGYVTDHINRNGLDNRKANLRLATVAQNAQNAGKRKNRSGYKGVWFAKPKRKWRAAIWKNNKRIHLGYFNSPEEAARAYDSAARRFHGQFANLNFPN